MAYPPAALPTNATDGASPTDTTPTAVLTAAEVNAMNAAVNDVVSELGSNPSGAAADVGARLTAIESAAAALPGTYAPLVTRSLIAAISDAAAPVGALILGDSTSFGSNTWSRQLASALASAFPSRKVSEYRWSDANQAYDLPTRLGSLGARGFTATTSSSCLRTVDAAANSLTGDMDVRCRLSLSDWTPGVSVDLFGKSTGTTQIAWWVGLTSSNQPYLAFSPDGTTGAVRYITASSPFPFTDGEAYWVRVQLDANNGASGCDVTFGYSTDGVTYTTHQAITTAGIAAIFDSTSYLQAPGRAGTVSTAVQITVYELQLLNALTGGVPVVQLDAGLMSSAATSATVSGLTGETWTVLNAGTLTGSPSVAVINGSASGKAIDYTQDGTRFTKLTPIPCHVAHINYGHNEGSKAGATFRTEYAALIASLRAKYADVIPVAVLQNPRTDPALTNAEHAARVSAVRAYAAASGIAAVDIFSAFSSSGLGLAALVDPSDGVHPYATGLTLAGDVVKRAYGLT